MFRTTLSLSAIILFLVAASSIGAVDRSGYDELSQLIDSAQVKEANVFAPKTWKKVEKKWNDARKSIELGKKQKSVDKAVAEAREYTENAIKATEVGKLTLQEYLEPREKAIAAKAPSLQPKLYEKAELQFIKATAKVESGNVKSGLKEAAKSVSLFRNVELEAIRSDILGPADRLIEKAMADDAGKFSLSTLDKAHTARTKANAIITRDRYNRDEAQIEATRAEYEARHASNIGLSVRSLKRNDQAWEKLMLIYEIQMNRVGKSIGVDHLPFDNGPLAAADTLINYIKNLKASSAQSSEQLATVSSDVSIQLSATLKRVNIEPTDNDPLALAMVLDKQIIEWLAERSQLAEQSEKAQSDLASLSQAHDAISGELSGRKATEEKFRKAKMMLNPSEGEVLFNSSNDVVLRLSGLSFASGKSDIQDDHVQLLEKVKEVITMFPDAQYVIEGHTDAAGAAAANVTLSEKRAFAVMQYLRQSLLLPANKIQSMGYGADKPIASNQTPDGRAKNRRIDIIIMR